MRLADVFLAAALLLMPAHAYAEAGALKIQNAWSRATPPGAASGVVYMTIDNTGGEDDILISASSPAAANTMVHESRMDGGVMKMAHVMALPVPARASVELKPGGLHVMLMGLKAPLRGGDVLPLTLTFKKAGALSVEVPILKPGKSLDNTH